MYVCIQDVHQEAWVELGEFPEAPGPHILAYATQEQERFCLKEGENQSISPSVVAWHLNRRSGTQKKKKISRRGNLILRVCQCFKKNHTKCQVTNTEFLLAYNIFIFENHSERGFNSC